MQAEMPVFIDFNEGILWGIMVKPEFYTKKSVAATLKKNLLNIIPINSSTIALAI